MQQFVDAGPDGRGPVDLKEKIRDVAYAHAVFLRELPDHRVRISLRSKGPVNVADVAQQFGGGGHVHASGCTLEGPLYSAMDRLLDRIRQHLCPRSVAGVA